MLREYTDGMHTSCHRHGRMSFPTVTGATHQHPFEMAVFVRTEVLLHTDILLNYADDAAHVPNKQTNDIPTPSPTPTGIMVGPGLGLAGVM